MFTILEKQPIYLFIDIDAIGKIGVKLKNIFDFDIFLLFTEEIGGFLILIIYSLKYLKRHSEFINL